MTLRHLVPLLACACALAVPAAARAVPVATPAGATAVREHRGIIAFSQFDPATREWRLAVRRPGGATELLPVRPADRPFHADIGPNGKGEPQLIYERCDETCDLFVYALSGSGGERAVRNANDPANSDTEPTIWRGQIAWARIYGEQRDRKVVVYTKSLTAPRSRPSTRLPGVPLRRCGDIDRDCGPTTGRAVEGLELWGANLGQIVRYECTVGCSGTSQTEVRLVRVPGGSARQIAFQTTGLSGQSFAGPAFAGGWLGWYRACLGDASGCRNGASGPWRFNVRSGAYARAAGPVRVGGFADQGSYLYETVDCNAETGEAIFNAQCRIEELPLPDFEPARAPLRG